MNLHKGRQTCGHSPRVSLIRDLSHCAPARWRDGTGMRFWAAVTMVPDAFAPEV